MKKPYIIAIAILTSITMTSCMKPVRIDPLEEIQPNETAFVIPLEGENLESQKQMESVEYLESRKVASKRITIPLRERQIGRMEHEVEWIPTLKVVKVDRTPVTRSFTQESKNAEPIDVESLDSIGFSVGVNVTAFIEETDTAKFLYYYRSQTLAQVMDQNVRGYIQTVLSEEFGSRTLALCKAEKNEAFNVLREKCVPHFKKYGITISSLGMAEGLTYEDKVIQEAINLSYQAEQNVFHQQQEKEAQKQINERLLSVAENERRQAEEFAKAADARSKQVEVEVRLKQAQAMLNFSEKWNGNVPHFLTVGGDNGNPFLFNIDSNKQN